MQVKNFLPLLALLGLSAPAAAQLPFFAGDDTPDTQVYIAPDPDDGGKAKFYINGELTYSELDVPQASKGLLQNIRWVQATIDDLDGNEASGWPLVNGDFDAQANTQKFIDAMDEWKAYGIRAFTLNMQGGCQCVGGVSGNSQGSLDNNPYGSTGEKCFVDWDMGVASEEAAYLTRMGSFIRAADDRGIVVILGLFYFGQDERLNGNAAVRLATERTVQWVIENNFTNVIFEVANEFGIQNPGPWYEHSYLNDGQVGFLLDLIHELTNNDGVEDSVGFLSNPNWVVPTLPQQHALTTNSRSGGGLNPVHWVQNADFLLLHGNTLNSTGVTNLVAATRNQLTSNGFGPFGKPIVFNEDPGLNDTNLGLKVPNMQAAYDAGASWGLYWDKYHQSAPFEPEIAELSNPDMEVLAEAYIEILGSPSVGMPYCRPAAPNSTGNWAHIYANGSTAVQDNDLVLLATGLPKLTFGIFSVGDQQSSVMVPNSQGVLCNQSLVFGRFPQILTADNAGCFSLELDLTDFPIGLGGFPVSIGETWNFQAWYRDLNPIVTSNFTDAVSITFQ